ncbi:MAG: type II secretion system F family protein [Acidimicrobiales bacterium]
MTPAVLAGGLVGVGLWAAWTGWRPAAEPLARVLARFGQPLPDVEPLRENLDARLGAQLRHIGLVDQALDAMRTDLRVLRRSPDEQAALMVTYALLGLLWGPVVFAGAWLVGVRFPMVIPGSLALVGAAIGIVSPLRTVRTQAAERRRAFSHALSGYCDVVGMCLAAGRGVEQALETGASVGDGWPFQEIRGALTSGYIRGDTPWVALERLGAEIGADDLIELGSAISLAGEEGAAVRETVTSKAEAIRKRLTAETEGTAASVTERMGVPAAMLLIGFLVFIGYPALAVIFQAK